MPKTDNVPLDQLKGGACAIVRKLRGGTDFINRLASMGLSVGSQLEVLQNRGSGPVLVLVRGTRIALGRGEALKILLQESECEQRASEQ